MIEVLKKQFIEYNFKYSIGGQISFDVFPHGWDKTYCLKFVSDFKNIYFIGDKTDIGGNDYEIYESERTISFKTKGVDDTIDIIKKIKKK
jgi:phosphomannomutase